MMGSGKRLAGLIAFPALTLLAGTLAGLWSGDGSEWYRGLRRPSFTPPGWVFGPVWTVLYVSMGVAAWRVWSRGGFAGARAALTLYGVQLALNLGWTALFFVLKSPAAAFAEILVLWAAIAATTAAFFRSSRAAGLLMMPYLAWVAFAAVLNGAIWRLNP